MNLLSKKWLNIYWPPGEYAMIKLFDLNILNTFYRDCFNLLTGLIKNQYNELIFDAINYNKFLLRKPKIFEDDQTLELKYDIPKIYETLP